MNGVPAVIDKNGSVSRSYMQSEIFEARHREITTLEKFLDLHVAALDAEYHAKKDPAFGDTIAYYCSKTMCEKFRTELHRMHNFATNQQFDQMLGDKNATY